MRNFATTFDELPIDVLENIFQYLSYEDILKCKIVVPDLQETCNRYIMKNIDFVFKDIFKCMETLDEQINGINLKFKEKRKLLRSFNVLENLKFTLELILILIRPDIGPNITYLLAQIFDNSKDVINLAKRNPYNIKALYIASMWPQNDISDLLIKNDVLNYADIGVRIVDYLDVMCYVHYNINVTYYIKHKVCVVNGNYYLKHSKLLFYLPDIPFIKSCSGRTVTEVEQIALMKYLALLVNVHNKMIMKTEQTKRDLELSKWELLKSSLTTQGKVETQRKIYNFSRRYCNRNVVDSQDQIINEIYTNCDNCNHDNLQQGIKCTIYLKCKIDDAPIQVIKNYKNLRNDLSKLDLSMCVKNNENDVDDDLDEIYIFDLKLDINLSTKKMDILELHFNHNKQELVNNTNLYK